MDIYTGKPVAYQEQGRKREYIEAEYFVDKNTYGFIVGDYDKSRTLVIDPLIAATFIGGSGYEAIHGLEVDENKNVYITGSTNEVDFPVTIGPYTGYSGTRYKCFVSKYNEKLELLSSTIIDGSDDDYSYAIVLGQGAVFITGETLSWDFPTTEGAYK